MSDKELAQTLRTLIHDLKPCVVAVQMIHQNLSGAKPDFVSIRELSEETENRLRSALAELQALLVKSEL